MATRKQRPVKNRRLHSFVQQLADDRAFRRRFQKDPEAAMAEHRLGVRQRSAVKAGQEEVRKLLSPRFAGAMMAIGHGRPPRR